ncbi:hypothetical protein SLEP1_g44190 [Rubroshorea leprosula]|uniref:Ankyrin repeat protein n=1 Tax=Rubroshorea leprosula TaxID=152421 RepID=A0AAV5LFF1_9ROSI|nr:hypothetical protein SLEP1_g44190 [Rubroshorea leprosula]
MFLPGTSESIERTTYLPLLKAIYLERNWDAVTCLLDNHPATTTVRFMHKGSTILNMVVLTGDLEKIEKLVQIVSTEELGTQDHEGNIALAIAAVLSTTRVAECLITKYQKLITIPDKNGMVPVVKACYYHHKDMTQFLYCQTPIEFLAPESGDHGSLLLHFCLLNKILGKS